MQRHEFETRVVEWLSDTLSAEQRTTFEVWLDDHPDEKAEALELQQVWSQLPIETTPDLKSRWRPHLDAAMAQPPTAATHSGQVWFAAAATLILGIAIGWLMPRDAGQTELLRSEIQSLQGAMAVNLVRMESASDRLAGVALAAQLAGSQPELAHTLTGLLKQDQNLNVRLAAQDALIQAGRIEDLNRALAELKPEDPYTQWLETQPESGSIQEL